MKCKGVVHRERLDHLIPLPNLPEVDIVTARAFAPLTLLLSYAQPFMLRGAMGFFHKGQDVDTELNEAAKSWKLSSIRHNSITDSQSVILEIKEAIYVKP